MQFAIWPASPLLLKDRIQNAETGYVTPILRQQLTRNSHFWIFSTPLLNCCNPLLTYTMPNFGDAAKHLVIKNKKDTYSSVLPFSAETANHLKAQLHRDTDFIAFVTSELRDAPGNPSQSHQLLVIIQGRFMAFSAPIYFQEEDGDVDVIFANCSNEMSDTTLVTIPVENLTKKVVAMTTRSEADRHGLQILDRDPINDVTEADEAANIVDRGNGPTRLGFPEASQPGGNPVFVAIGKCFCVVPGVELPPFGCPLGDHAARRCPCYPRRAYAGVD